MSYRRNAEGKRLISALGSLLPRHPLGSGCKVSHHLGRTSEDLPQVIRTCVGVSISGNRHLAAGVRTEGTSHSETGIQIESVRVLSLQVGIKGVARPDFSAATDYTNWWVRSNPNESFKLIRSRRTLANGSDLVEDTSAAARNLADFMGMNCFRSFGQ